MVPQARGRRPGCARRWTGMLALAALLIVPFPPSAWAVDLPSADPQTLQQAIEDVRSLEQAGASRSAVASWLTGVLDRRMVNVNSFERMSIPGNWMSIFGESSADKDFGEWRDRNDFDNKNTAEWAWEHGLGQCSEQANTAYYILRQAGVEGNVRILTAPGHEIAVWGMRDGADPNDPGTWGDDAYVVDGWLGKAMTAAEAEENSYLKGGAGSDRVIIDSTNSFDKTAEPWRVEGSGGAQSTGEEIDCFVATVAYGTSVAEEIGVLREFREGVLRPSSAGRAFIGWYERNGPGLARWIAEHDTFKAVVRDGFLRPLDAVLRLTHPLWDDASAPAQSPSPPSEEGGS